MQAHPKNLATKMPSKSHTTSTTTVILLTLFLIISLFPDLFHFIWALLLRILASVFFFHDSSPSNTPHPQTPPVVPMTSSWFQKQFNLPARSRGSYLITDIVVNALPEIRDYKVGLLNLFVQHTSCALSLNENWDEDVRADMSDALDRIAPDSGPKGQELYRHSAEGPDDMPVG
jgi:hypothetical protein